MCCAQWRQQQPDANALFRKLDQAWQDASPLQRRLAVATATTLRRPPHPLRRTGAAQHHLSPMRASSAKRDNAGGERARARRKAAWCRCRKAWRLRLGFSPNEAWRPVATVPAFPLRAPSPKCFECEARVVPRVVGSKRGQSAHFALTRARGPRRRRPLAVHRRDSAQEHGHHQCACSRPISEIRRPSSQTGESPQAPTQ